MAKGVRVSILPVVGGLAALFLVLPHTGADAKIAMTGPEGEWTFSPDELRAEPGARVAFTNRTHITHTATCASFEGDPSPCTWDTGDVQPGQTVFVTLPDADATYSFGCRYHARNFGMAGRLITGAGSSVPVPSPSPT
jgi:plastocyanin